MAGPVHESDFRCEFDLPKFVNLRQSMLTRSQKASILSIPGGRDTLASAITAPTNKASIGVNEDPRREDPNYDWFQEDHDFKIMTRAQMKEIERHRQAVRLRPKLNTTAPVASNSAPMVKTTTTAVSKKRTWKEQTQPEAGIASKKPSPQRPLKRLKEQTISFI